MHKKFIALILSIIFPLSLIFQGCGANGPIPKPIDPDTKYLIEGITDYACRENNDDNPDNDEYCTKDEQAIDLNKGLPKSSPSATDPTTPAPEEREDNTPYNAWHLGAALIAGALIGWEINNLGLNKQRIEKVGTWIKLKIDAITKGGSKIKIGSEYKTDQQSKILIKKHNGRHILITDKTVEFDQDLIFNNQSVGKEARVCITSDYEIDSLQNKKKVDSNFLEVALTLVIEKKAKDYENNASEIVDQLCNGTHPQYKNGVYIAFKQSNDAQTYIVVRLPQKFFNYMDSNQPNINASTTTIKFEKINTAAPRLIFKNVDNDNYGDQVGFTLNGNTIWTLNYSALKTYDDFLSYLLLQKDDISENAELVFSQQTKILVTALSN